MTTAQVALPAPFTWDAGSIAMSLPGGEVRFTTRRTHGAASGLESWEGSAPCEAVDVLAASAGIATGRVAQSRQVHGTSVRVIGAADDLERSSAEHDGQVTGLAGVVCLVRVADCLPVALIAPEAVGVVHAGWRGLAAGVIEAGVGALRAAGASEIRAAIGPGAGACCYEAGEEVHRALSARGAPAPAGSNADLKGAARAALERAGVAEVHDTGLCTICAPAGLLWSHRREGAAAGRQGGAAWRS